MDKQRQIYIPPEGPPTERPDPEIYQRMGEENIFLMLSDFYAELEKSPLRPMFPQDMKEASQKTAAFFVFLLGGPPLYQERHGPPMMRKRHLPFIIDEQARQIWLGCFHKILDEEPEKYQFPLDYKDNFFQFLDRFSAWMVNTRSY